jgi:hypothetical protein
MQHTKIVVHGLSQPHSHQKKENVDNSLLMPKFDNILLRIFINESPFIHPSKPTPLISGGDYGFHQHLLNTKCDRHRFRW